MLGKLVTRNRDKKKLCPRQSALTKQLKDSLGGKTMDETELKKFRRCTPVGGDNRRRPA